MPGYLPAPESFGVNPGQQLRGEGCANQYPIWW